MTICDHMHESGGWDGTPIYIYSKLRTENHPVLGKIHICDVCKTVIWEGEEICKEEDLEHIEMVSQFFSKGDQ